MDVVYSNFQNPVFYLKKRKKKVGPHKHNQEELILVHIPHVLQYDGRIVQ